MGRFWSRRYMIRPHDFRDLLIKYHPLRCLLAYCHHGDQHRCKGVQEIASSVLWLHCIPSRLGSYTLRYTYLTVLWRRCYFRAPVPRNSGYPGLKEDRAERAESARNCLKRSMYALVRGILLVHPIFNIQDHLTFWNIWCLATVPLAENS